MCVCVCVCVCVQVVCLLVNTFTEDSQTVEIKGKITTTLLTSYRN